LETLKTIENCTGYKDKKMNENDFDKFHESINEIENYLVEIEKEELAKKKEDIIYKLNDKLYKIMLLLCEGCKEEIKKLTDKCGNKEIARFLHECKLNAKHYYDEEYSRWIPFNKFRNIEYLAKGSFGEV